MDLVIPNYLRCTDITSCLNLLADAMIELLIPISILVIIYSAFVFLTSGGSEEKVRRARAMLLWIVVGLFVTLIAKGVAVLLRDVLSGA